MALSKEQIKSVEDVLRNSLRNKFLNYKPEPASMPFHIRLLGKDRMALFSFIHSLNTNFGQVFLNPLPKQSQQIIFHLHYRNKLREHKLVRKHFL